MIWMVFHILGDTDTNPCVKHKAVLERWASDGGLNNLRPPAWIPAAPPIAFMRAAPRLSRLFSAGFHILQLQSAILVVADLPLVETFGLGYSRRRMGLVFVPSRLVAGCDSASATDHMCQCAASTLVQMQSLSRLGRRFLFMGVSLVSLFPLSKHSADVATARAHTLYKYIDTVVSATTIAVASVHPGFELGCAMIRITITGYTGHPVRSVDISRYYTKWVILNRYRKFN